jgi:phytoene synthase
MNQPTASSAIEAALRHCENEVRAADKDRFLAALFAPAEHRPPLLALYAFDLEIRRIAGRIREPLAGELRLQWWREVLEGKRGEEAQANPVAAAFLATLGQHALGREGLFEYLDARSLDLYAEPFATLASLKDYARAAEGCVLALAASIVSASAVSDQAHEDAAVAFALCDVLRTIGPDRAHGRVRIPSDVLGGQEASPADVLGARNPAQVRAAVLELRAIADQRVRRFFEAAATLPERARSAYLPMAVVPLYLGAMGPPSWDLYTSAEVAQWKRQWHIWRVARRWRAA